MLYHRTPAVCPNLLSVETNQVVLLYVLQQHLTAVVLCSSLCTSTVLARLKTPLSVHRSFLTSCEPQEGNMGIHAHFQAVFSACKCVCCKCCGLRLRGGDGIRVFLFQNSLSCFVAHSHSPRSDFFLNDGVETCGIFEVFSQSVFLRANDGNSIFGFKMADMSCTNTYLLTYKHTFCHTRWTHN